MTKRDISICVNGKWYELAVEPYETLLDVLRDRLGGLTGTKSGCAKGECGACTVNIAGKAILSCLTLAVQVDGKEILTIEGLSKGAELHPLQEAFVKQAAVQCGYCTPGMIMNAKALLDHNSNPSEKEVRKTLSSNLCRCTGYERPVKAILEAATIMRGKDER